MASGGESQKKTKYAYCILYYNGEDELEYGECKAFVEMLQKKFRDKVSPKKYRVNSEWTPVGGNEVAYHPKIMKQSYFTIVLFSRKYETEDLKSYFGQSFFKSLVHTERYFPVSINDTPVPDYLNAIAPVKFRQDFRSDKRSWDTLVNAIYKKRKNFKEITGSDSESDTESDVDSESEEQPAEAGMFYFWENFKNKNESLLQT